jgi:hypothetical protein
MSEHGAGRFHVPLRHAYGHLDFSLDQACDEPPIARYVRASGDS